jgi:uncharacterized protein
MEIKRDVYLSKLVSSMWNGQIKVITGIRRCGKSYLLHVLFKKYLLENGVKEENIISVELDLLRDICFRNPLELSSFITSKIQNKTEKFYLFIDEIQLSDEIKNPYNPEGKKITFYDVLNDLREYHNLDVYVTGSNSKMLSSDILTEFRGRSDEIRVHPLSFAEFYSVYNGEKSDAFEEYCFYGGLPFVLSKSDDTAKMEYLTSLFSEVYIKDIVERKKIEREDVLSKILDLICSSVGSLTNPKKIADTLRSKTKTEVSDVTVSSYIKYLEDAFLLSEAKRYDVCGKSYFDFPSKFYCEDVGLRNARIGFRQQEMTHIMENVVYNELKIRGFLVGVGVVYSRELNQNKNSVRVSREIDFVASKGGKKIYIQSAFALQTEEKSLLELKPFSLTGDSFPKIIVRGDIRKRWYDDNGILNIGITDFLLDKNLF